MRRLGGYLGLPFSTIDLVLGRVGLRSWLLDLGSKPEAEATPVFKFGILYARCTFSSHSFISAILSNNNEWRPAGSGRGADRDGDKRGCLCRGLFRKPSGQVPSTFIREAAASNVPG